MQQGGERFCELTGVEQSGKGLQGGRGQFSGGSGRTQLGLQAEAITLVGSAQLVYAGVVDLNETSFRFL